MALAMTVPIGSMVELEHVQHGIIGTVRVDAKTGNAVRLIFQMPRSILIRVMDHRQHGITWGLSSQPRGPLAVA